MKKLILVVSLVLVTFLSGCTKEVSSETFKEGLIEYNTSLESYYACVDLEIIKDEEVIEFECEIYYLADDYYKVIMKDVQTNNTQAIVKNIEGVFVLTPVLNKQFKFNNDWPLNSSHAYLYQSLIKDITNDEESTVIKEDNDYVVTSTYNSKSNASLTNQKVTFSSEYKPLYCIVMNDANETQIKATYTEFIDTYKLKKSDFDTQAINTSLRLEMGEGSIMTDISTVKPTYAPEGSEIASSVIKDEYVIYTYSGDTSYTITCNYVEEDESLGLYRTYDDILLLTHGLAASNDNSITFYSMNVQVTIYSENLSLDEMVNIANSF